MQSIHPQAHGLHRSFARAILRHGGLIVGIFLLITAFAVYEITQASVGNSLLEVFMDDLTEYQENLRIAELLGGDSDDLIFLGAREGPELFTTSKLNALRETARALEELPDVLKAITFVDLPSVSTTERLSIGDVAARAAARQKILGGQVPSGSVRPRLYWPILQHQQARVDLDSLRADLLNDESVVGTFLSKNGTCWGMILKLSSGRQIPIFQQIQLRKSILATVRQHKLGEHDVYAAGLIISQGWLFEEMLKGFYLIAPLVLLAISSTVYLIFRHWITVVVAVSIAILSTLWGIGFTIFYFGEISMFVAAAPPVIFTITTSDFIHLTSTFRTELDDGHSIPDALEKTITEVGGACMLTSLTTMVGFASLATVPVPATRHFAIAAAMGVAAAFFLQMIGPIIYLRFGIRLSSVSSRLQVRIVSFFDYIVVVCRHFSVRYPYAIIVAAAALIVGAFLSASKLSFSSDFPSRFPPQHSIAKSTAFFNEELSGTSHIELLLRLNEHRAIEPLVLESLATMEEKLRLISDVRAVHSVLTPLRSLGNALRMQTDDGLPPNQEAIEASLRLIDLHDDSISQGFVSPTRDLLRVFVQVLPTDFLEVAKLGKQIESVAQESFPIDMQIQAQSTGTMPVVGRSAQKIIASQLQGNWICLIAITMIMAVSLGSLRVSLLAQIPNLIPLAILVGFATWIFERIDSDLLGLPMIALGLAVDDTIHFLHRYRLQLATGENHRDALESTFRFTGRAIVQSAFILCIGLAPCALSNYLGVRMIGTLLVFTLGCGLIADLLLVPALIQTRIIRWRET